MIRHNNGREFFTFESDGFSSMIHGIFSRRGGFSPRPWNSLNIGGTVGDDPVNVRKNHELIFNSLGRSLETKYDVWQVHSTTSVFTSEARGIDQPHLKADAIFTDNPGVTLVMRFADCVPILVSDPVLRVVGIIHAGWQGTVNQIASKAINDMCSRYDSNPKNIFAAIGPSIGPDHYSVGEDVHEIGRSVFSEVYKEVFEQLGDAKYSFDLWRANEYLLQKAGINQIERADICTACNLKDWYSHRAENGKTGRFGALIAIGE